MAYARVVSFEGDPEKVRAAVSEINSRSESGPPEGVPAKEFLMLHNDEGKALAIVLFDSEEDMRQGDKVLGEMSPPDDAMRRAGPAEFFEVGVRRSTG